MKKFWIGLIVGLQLVPLIVGIYILSGLVPVAATDGPMPFEQFLAGGGVYARIRKEAPSRDLSALTPADLVAGAVVYQKDCAFCHGMPQQHNSPIGAGMFPHAPQLFTQDGAVTDDPVGESYWKVKNGIRLTGMPSFEASLADQQMWQVSALVARADKLPPEALDALKPGIAPPAAAVNAPAAGAPNKTK